MALIPISALFFVFPALGAPSPGATPAPSKEQTVYVPFEKLEQVFENEGRGVFLPYREFLEMWNKVKMPEDLAKKDPPLDGVLSAAHYTGKVEGDAAVISAKLNMEALKEGWSTLKLGSGDWSIADVKSAANLSRSGKDYNVIFPNKGKYELQMTIFGRIQREAGRSSLRLNLPRTAVSQFEMVIPDKALEFTLTPACAYTTAEQPDGSTRLAVYFGASEEVNISWQKRAGETALTPLLFTETKAAMKLSPGAVRTAFDVQYRILRAGVSTFELTVPAGQQVLSIDGANLRDWTVAGRGGIQIIKVNLHTPARDTYALRVNVESSIASLPAKLALPSVDALNVERQSGIIDITADNELLAETADLQGLAQQSASGSRDGTLVGRYRYLRLPFSGTVAVSEAKPVVEVNSKTMLTVEPETQRLQSTFNYTVKKAGIFSTSIILPGGFEQAEASGEGVEGSTVQDVNGKKVLNVTFTARRTSSFSFNVAAETARKDPVETVAVPVLVPQDVQRHEAVVGMAIHVSLKANTTDMGGMRQQSIQMLESSPNKNESTTPSSLGFRYRGEVKPAQIAFELRKPRVSAEVLASTEVREALIRNRWFINYKVEYAGVDEFSVSTPKAIADEIQIDGLNIKERTKVDEKNEKGEPTGNVLWRVALQDKKLGDYQLVLTLETPQTQLKQGSTAVVALNEIKPLNVFRETGQIAVIKDGNLEFTKTDTKGLEQIDPTELNPQIQANGVFLAYKYAAHPIALALNISKNSYQEVPQALVSYAVFTSVIAENKAQTTEAIYWVRNNSQQFLSLQLPPNGKMLSDAFVNGEPQQPSRRSEKNEMLIRLPAQQTNEPFAVRFVYEVPSPAPGKGLSWLGSIKVEPPTVNDTRVMQSKWTFYLPGGNRYVRFAGPMKEATTSWGWDRFRRKMSGFVPNIGPTLQGTQAPELAEPPVLPAAKNAGFDFQIPKEGGAVTLRRLDAPAAVSIQYRDKTFASILESVAFLVALLFGLKQLGSSRQAKFVYAILVGGGALILAGAVAPRAAGLWTAVYLGVLFAVLAWTGMAIYRKLIALPSFLAGLFNRKSQPRVVAAHPAIPPSSTTPEPPSK